jgi:hypothetical protein
MKITVFVLKNKMVLLKVVLPFKMCQRTKFRGPPLSGESFTSTSEYRSPF